MAMVSNADLPCLLVQRVCRLRAGNGLKQEFLLALLRTIEFRQYIEADLTGVSVPHISADQIKAFRFRLPNEVEQEQWLLDAGLLFRKLDESEHKAEQLVDLLRERRSALISAAVTGKIDVREWRPPENNEAA